jgi:hypothetical protein
MGRRFSLGSYQTLGSVSILMEVSKRVIVKWEMTQTMIYGNGFPKFWR